MFRLLSRVYVNAEVKRGIKSLNGDYTCLLQMYSEDLFSCELSSEEVEFAFRTDMLFCADRLKMSRAAHIRVVRHFSTLIKRDLFGV